MAEINLMDPTQLQDVVTEQTNAASKSITDLQTQLPALTAKVMDINTKYNLGIDNFRREVDDSYSKSLEILQKKEDLAAYPSAITNIIGIFDSDFNKRKLDAQLHSEASRIQRASDLSKYLAGQRAAELSTVENTLQMGTKSAELAGANVRNLQTGIETTQQIKNNAVQNMSREELQKAAKGGNTAAQARLTSLQSGEKSVEGQDLNLKSTRISMMGQAKLQALLKDPNQAGAAQKEIQRRKQVEMELDTATIANNSGKLAARDQAIGRLLAQTSTDDLQEMIAEARTKKQGYIEVPTADGKPGIQIPLQAIQTEFNKQVEANKKTTDNAIAGAGIAPKEQAAVARMQNLDGVGALPPQLAATVKSLQDQMGAAKQLGDIPAMESKLDEINKILDKQAEDYIKKAPPSQRAVLNDVFNGGEITTPSAIMAIPDMVRGGAAYMGTKQEFVAKHLSKEFSAIAAAGSMGKDIAWVDGQMTEESMAAMLSQGSNSQFATAINVALQKPIVIEMADGRKEELTIAEYYANELGADALEKAIITMATENSAYAKYAAVSGTGESASYTGINYDYMTQGKDGSVKLSLGKLFKQMAIDTKAMREASEGRHVPELAQMLIDKMSSPDFKRLWAEDYKATQDLPQRTLEVLLSKGQPEKLMASNIQTYRSLAMNQKTVAEADMAAAQREAEMLYQRVPGTAQVTRNPGAR